MSYIEKEANKNQGVVDTIKEEINKSLPNSTVDSVNVGNLLGSVSSAFANLANMTSQTKAISIAVTTVNGAILNYGVNIAKDGEHNLKATFTGASGAVVSVGVAEGLGALTGAILRTVAVSAIVASGAPVAVTVLAGTAVVGASYLAGNYASHYAGKLYDMFFGETLEVNFKGESNNTIKTTENAQEILNNQDIQNMIKDKKNVTIEDNSGEIYTIENGNTVWDIAQKNNTTVDKLIELNPWLADNMSDDKSWILIKPGQTIELPQSDEQRSIDSGSEYNSQQAQQIIIDPLALDLNHNGKIDTTNANSSNTLFDMDNNGMSEITGWIDKEDGLLVYDKNNNGKIDNINELFGNENKDGYRELRELINSNDDNVIDKNDTKFKDLKIWQDLNGDGISQNNELKTLDELNITSINLNSKNTNIDDNGNNIFKTSTFTQNGQEYLSGDVNLAVDKRFTDFRGDYTLSVDALFLPWLRGYGDVKDAHIAYSMDEEFKEFTKTLVGDDEKAYNEFDTFLKKWSGLDKVHSANGITRDTLTMDDKVWIMETLSGKDFFKSRIETAYSNNRNSSNRYDTGYIDEQYNNLKTKNYSIFASQSFYKDGFNGSYYSVNQDKMVVYDKELLNNSIVEFINSSSNIKDAMGFVFALDKLKNDLDINIADLTNNITNNKEMIANVLNDTANLSIFQNSFHGSSGDDIVFGTDGDDNIYNKKMIA